LAIQKKGFLKSHLEIIKTFIEFSMIGSDITCNTGGHNGILRKLSTLEIRNSKLVDKLTLTLNGKEAWFFHGDVFDIFIQNAKWSAKLVGSDLIILGNGSLKFYKGK
jgi:UDP-2,3-diacylglucosamine pyrophosphatase LpxH